MCLLKWQIANPLLENNYNFSWNAASKGEAFNVVVTELSTACYEACWREQPNLTVYFFDYVIR